MLKIRMTVNDKYVGHIASSSNNADESALHSGNDSEISDIVTKPS